MSTKFLFVNTGTEPVTVKETFPEGTWNKTVVQPGDHRTFVVWAGKSVEVLTPPPAITQGQMYRGRSDS